jgi:hypothetical protein
MKTSTAYIGIIILLIALAAAPAAAGLTFVSSSPQTIAEGDAFTISGTGATNGSVSVMVFGRNYFSVFAATPDTQGNYSLTLPSSVTRNFQSGQYAFVILDPGADQKFEIATHVSGAGNITITDRGVPVADLGPASGLHTGVQPAVEAILDAAGRPGVDDIVTPVYFFVEVPYIQFSGTTDPATGELIPVQGTDGRLVFSGTTNMGCENTLTAEISSINGGHILSVPIPAIVPGSVPEPGIHKVMNSWSFGLDPAALGPGEYFVDVGWQKATNMGHAGALFTVPAEVTAHGQSGLLPVFQIPTVTSLAGNGTLDLPGFW